MRNMKPYIFVLLAVLLVVGVVGATEYTVMPTVGTTPSTYCYATAFSQDGNYMVLGSGNSPYILIYYKNLTDSSNWTKLSNPSTLPAGFSNGIAFSSDTSYIGYASTQNPYIVVYTKNLTDASNWTALPAMGTMPTSYSYDVDFSSDGSYMAIGHVNPPRLYLYTKNLTDASNWTALPAMGTMPSGDVYSVDFSEDGLYFAATSANSPYIYIYEKNLTDASNWTKLSNPVTLPAGTTRGVSFSHNSDFISVTHDTNPYITLYMKNSTDPSNWTKLPDTSILPSGGAYSSEFSSDDEWLLVGSSGSPYTVVYYKNLTDSSNWTKFSNQPTTTRYRRISISPNDDYFIACSGSSGSPYYTLISPSISNYYATPASGTEPLSVTFTNTEFGNITTYAWDFNNDGVVDSVLPNPVYAFSGGTYTTNLTVTSDLGSGVSDSEAKTDYISVYAAANANFTGTPLSGAIPLTVSFTYSGGTTYGTTTYAWDVDGDGVTDYTTQNCTHTYIYIGYYTVNLTVSQYGTTDTESKFSYVVATSQVSGSGVYYAPHQTRFITKYQDGNIIPGINITATPISTTMGGWEWLNDWLGIPESVDLQNTTMTGLTGTDGSLSFLMVEDIIYTINFTNATLGIDYTTTLSPKDTDYVFYFPRTADVNITPLSSCVNWSKWLSPSAGTLTFGALYTDSCNSTSNVSILAYYAANGTYVAGTYDNTPGTTENNISTSFAYGSGVEYEIWLVYNTTSGNYVHKFPFSAPITPPTTEVPAWVLQWAAVGFLMLLGAVFSVTSVKFGVILVPVFAGLFAYMGWITLGTAVIPFLLTLGVLYYMRTQERQVV